MIGMIGTEGTKGGGGRTGETMRKGSIGSTGRREEGGGTPGTRPGPERPAGIGAKTGRNCTRFEQVHANDVGGGTINGFIKSEDEILKYKKNKKKVKKSKRQKKI